MAITFVGQATGVTSATLPTHQSGDIIVCFAFRDGSTTAPTLVGGWTSIGTNTAATSTSSRLAWIRASGSGTVSGTWTNATSVVFLVYRGCHSTSAIGGSATSQAASTTVTYPAVTMSVSSGTSWVIAMAGHRSVNTTLETAPAGMINRANVLDATDEASGHDTNGGVSSWSSTDVSVAGTSSGWNSWVLELIADPVTTTKTTTSAGDVRATTSKTTTAVSKVSVTATQTLTAVSRLRKTVSSTITAAARVTATTTKTTTAVARIQKTASSTQSSDSRLVLTSTKTTTAVAKVQGTSSATTTAVAKVQATTTKTTTSVAAVRSTVQRTSTAQTRVQVVSSSTITAATAVRKTSSQTISSVARVGVTSTQTATAVARVRATTQKTQTATATLQVVSTVSHTTSSVLQLVATKSHTTDSVLRATKTASHTTDTYLAASVIQATVSHTTDVLLAVDGKLYSRQQGSVLPSTDAELSTLYVGSDYGKVSADDTDLVLQPGSSFYRSGYMIHQYKQRGNNVSPFTATWTGQSKIPTTLKPVTLEVYNRNSGLWEAIDSDSTSGSYVDFTLVGSVNSNLSDYFDGNNWLSFRVWQEA